jgi:hypothetical protein
LTPRERGFAFTISRLVGFPIRRLALRMAAQNVCITDWAKGNIRAPHSITIWNPVDIATFECTQTNQTPGRFTFVGRLGREKGADVLLRAIAIC